jgi:ketol-acid reductoisomerase
MAQSLNMRDNKLKVVIGVRKGGASWNDAIKDGWVPGETLFSIEEACTKGTVVMNLLSDAGQKDAWKTMKPFLTKGILFEQPSERSEAADQREVRAKGEESRRYSN